MAKIVCEFDSIEKTAVITKDGKTFPNVDSFSCGKIYSEDGKYYCMMNQYVEDEENDIRTYVSTNASEGKQAISDGFLPNELIEGFVSKPSNSKLIDDVMTYMGHTSR